MSFNTTTGALTGTPTTTAPATVYTVTATNSYGSATRTFTLTVLQSLNPVFTLSSSSETGIVNAVANGFTVNSTGGPIASFAINDTPDGMSFNTTTGALTGTPTTAAPATVYTVTATNSYGSATRTFTLTVRSEFPCSGGGGFLVVNNVVVGRQGLLCVGTAVIPEGIVEIGDHAFQSHSGLTSVQLPNSLERIGVAAFAYSGITSLTIPPSVTSVGNQAFQAAYFLRNLIVSGNPTTPTVFGTSTFLQLALDSLTLGVGDGQVTLENGSETRVLAGLGRASTITLGAGLVSAGKGLQPDTVFERVNDFSSTDLAGSGFDRSIPRYVADPIFTLSSSSETRAVNTAATGFTISGNVGNYSINATPPGMSFNTSTGALTGTPTTVAPATVYTITGFNSASESATQTFTLTVSLFTLSSSSETRMVNTVATGFTINGNVGNFSIDSTPPGMSFNTSTGALTGTPTTIAPATVYTITGIKSESETAIQTFTLTVTAAPVVPAAAPAAPAAAVPVAPAAAVPVAPAAAVPVAPAAAPAAAPKLNAITPIAEKQGKPYVMVNGVETDVKIGAKTNSEGIEVIANGWSLALSVVKSDGKIAPLSTQQSLLLSENQQLTVSGPGFKPNSEVYIYLFSNPILVGTTTTDSKGYFVGAFPMPAGVDEGNHFIQINGISPDNYLRSTTLPAVYEKSKPVVTPPVTPVDTPVAPPAVAPVMKKMVFVVPFASLKYSLSAAQKSGLLASVNKVQASQIEIVGYAQSSKLQPAIALSLDRAIEVKKLISKVAPSAAFSVRGSGPKKQSLCAKHNNECAVVTITQG
jgi:hypothetical protein